MNCLNDHILTQIKRKCDEVHFGQSPIFDQVNIEFEGVDYGSCEFVVSVVPSDYEYYDYLLESYNIEDKEIELKTNKIIKQW